MTHPPHQGRWIRLTLAILVIVGLSYGAWRFWNERVRRSAPVISSTVIGESIIIPVEGMSCSMCVARVKKTLKESGGVSEAHVSLEKREAQVRYDPAKISPEKLVKAIDALGYKAGPVRATERSQ